MNPTDARVLVVDDSESMRRVVHRVLAEVGFVDIDEAEDGVEGLEKATGAHYHLVITDWNMPRMDGIGLVRALRASPATHDVPVLIVTGEVTRERVFEAAEAGVSGFVVKPFVSPTLEEKVRAVLALPPRFRGLRAPLIH